MASISSQEPPMSQPNGLDLDHCSASPSQTLPENPEDPLEVEEEPNLESNTGDESETEMKPETKTPKSRGRLKKKDKHKQPVSETGNRPKPDTENGYDRPDYSSQFQDETMNMFMPSDLVWGKVKNYPWWPGLIFDPVDASELALKHRNKNNFLVAYFYDNTFAWNEASVLKPFQSNFSRMVKQSSTVSFMSAVEEALAEVSRRVGSVLSCGCYNAGESNAEPKFENAGIRVNMTRPSGDVSFIRNSFNPSKFLRFLCELGQNPCGGFDSLDLVVAKSQLNAFSRSRRCSFDLSEFCYTCAFDEETINPVTSDRIYTRKHKPIDGDSNEKPIVKKHGPEEEGRKKKRLSEIFKEIMRTPKRSKVRVGGPSGSDNSGKYKKKRLDSLGDLGTKSRARRKYMRVGQCMRKAANHVTHTKPTPKPNGISSRKRKCLSMIKDRVENKPLHRLKGIVYSDNLLRAKSGVNKKRVLRERENDDGSSEDHSSSSDMLSQLYLVAQDPLNGCSFITMIDSFFTGFRGYVLNPSTGKRIQRRSVSRKLDLMGDEDRDSCMTDHIADDNDNIKLAILSQKRQKNRKRVKKNVLEGNYAISGGNNNGDLANENKQECNLGISCANTNGNLANENEEELNLGISDTNKCEPIPEVNESMPTTLMLNFEETAQLPTEPELNGPFTCFGPLMEAETEVSEKENSAPVVFERHVNAEVAFSDAGKMDAFRSEPVSFQLSCAPTSSNIELTTAQFELQGEKDAASPVNDAC